MRIALQFLLMMGLAIHAAATTSCSPVPGADQIWSKSSVHWVFIGELHGSNETPAAFGNLVCDAIAHGKHVTVALERPSSEQTALDNVLTAKDLAKLRKSYSSYRAGKRSWMVERAKRCCGCWSLCESFTGSIPT